MKYTLILLLTLLITLSSFAQTGFNYKAAIKDDNGNLLISQDIDVRFTLLYIDIEFGTLPYYEELHHTATDSNGLIVLNIGEGNIVFGTFPQNGWNTTTTLLIGIDVETDGTFETMPITNFKKVPMANRADYATQANTANTALNVSGLEQIFEGSNAGWRLIDGEFGNHGTIGDNAIDLSIQQNSSSTAGATGEFSIAMGASTQASGSSSTVLGRGSRAEGFTSTAMGNNTVASGSSSTSMGRITTASGFSSIATGNDTRATGSTSTAMGNSTNAYGSISTAIGNETTAFSFAETVIGSNNTIYAPSGSTIWESGDRLFVIGNGPDFNTPNDALIVYKNGNAKFDAEIQTTKTGNANMIPIAYGMIDSNANILSGTGNFTVTTPQSPTFQIEVTGESLSASNSAILITPLAGVFRTASTSYTNGDVRVYIFNSGGTQVTNTFQFVIYKL